LNVSLPQGLQLGDLGPVTFHVRNPSDVPVRLVRLSLLEAHRVLSPESTIEASCDELPPDGVEELDLPHVEPKRSGVLRHDVRVLFRDGKERDWRLQAKLDLVVKSPDKGGPTLVINGVEVHQNVDTTLRTQATGVVIQAPASPPSALPHTGEPLPLPLRVIRCHLPDEERLLHAGTRLPGGYRIVHEVARGGFAGVYLAEKSLFDGSTRPCAIKALKPDLLDSDRARGAFEREARIAMDLSHDHIVTLRDWNFYGRTPFLVFDYVNGRSADGLLADHPEGVPWREVVRIGRDLCTALSYAHTRTPAVCHRDIKPSNVLLDSDGTALLADFNVAHEINTQATRLTGHLPSGTTAYMAPEWLSSEADDLPRELLPRGDIWSLGITLYELLRTKPPFSPDRGQVLAQIERRTLRPLPGVPMELSQAVLRCLRKRPEERWTDAAELEQVLNSLLTDESTAEIAVDENERPGVLSQPAAPETSGPRSKEEKRRTPQERTPNTARGTTAQSVQRPSPKRTRPSSKGYPKKNTSAKNGWRIAIAGVLLLAGLAALLVVGIAASSKLISRWSGASAEADSPQNTGGASERDASADVPHVDGRGEEESALDTTAVHNADTTPRSEEDTTVTPEPTRRPLVEESSLAMSGQLDKPSNPPPAIDWKSEEPATSSINRPPEVSFSSSEKRAERMGTIVIQSDVDGAIAVIEGQEIGLTPQTLDYPVGVHSLKVKKSGYLSHTQEFEVQEGKKTVLDITLELVSGQLIFDVWPDGAHVSMDGEVVGETPTLKRLEVIPGAHTLALEKDGYKKWEQTIRVAPKQSVTINAYLARILHQ